MPTTSLTIGNELLSTTMHILMKEWRDNVHESTAFLDATLSAPWRFPLRRR